MKTRFAQAMLVFSLAGFAAACFQFCLRNPLDFPYYSWTAWTLQDFFQQKEKPGVVFLGSSLVLVPLAGVEADHLKHRIDGSQHHRSTYFEDKLARDTGLKARTFNFALPGEMPSDAYLVVKNLLKGEHKPDAIIYGVGPRDFMDNMLPGPSATDSYRFLSRFGEINSDNYMPGFQEKLDYLLGKLSYFYGNREDISLAAYRQASKVVNKICPLPAEAKAISFEERHALLPGLRPWEMPQGQAWFRPSTAADHESFDSSNLAEYRNRYKKLNWDTYISQMRFFAETLKLARENGIKVVVVTMPITDLNRSLLSNLSWAAYRNGVIGMAKRKGAAVIDLSESAEFTRRDFLDTVHLHSGGGKRLLDLISKNLAAEPEFLAAMKCAQEKSRIAQKGESL